MIEFKAQKFKLFNPGTGTHEPIDALMNGDGVNIDGIVTPQMYGAKGD